MLSLCLSHLSEAERRAHVLADNKLALNAGWDKEILAIELQALVDLEFDVEITGFSLAEIDFVPEEAGEADPDGSGTPEDAVPVLFGEPVMRMGDLWQLRPPPVAVRRHASRRDDDDGSAARCKMAAVLR